MAGDQAILMPLIRSIIVGHDSDALCLLADSPALVTARVREGATRQAAKQHFLVEIRHYIYAGDTALHIAAAAHRPLIVRELLAMGADARAMNRRLGSCL